MTRTRPCGDCEEVPPQPAHTASSLRISVRGMPHEVPSGGDHVVSGTPVASGKRAIRLKGRPLTWLNVPAMYMFCPSEIIDVTVEPALMSLTSGSTRPVSTENAPK